MPELPFTDRVWVAITRDEHGHGGEGWEFGSCLWSPERDNGGRDRYAIMRQPESGDRVIHFLHTVLDGEIDTFVLGTSKVHFECRVVESEPPRPGVWSDMGNYYRIDLADFSRFQTPLSVRQLIEHYGEEIRREIIEHRPRYYPLATYGPTLRLQQGLYLGRCTSNLLTILQQALSLEEVEVNVTARANAHDEFSEGLRKAREVYFFSRNPSLAKKAKQARGYQCEACGFRFVEVYGVLGEDYIECHHLSPLSERAESEWTSEVRTRIDEVAVVCANCHRMLHRRRPAFSMDELRQVIRKGSLVKGGKLL